MISINHPVTIHSPFFSKVYTFFSSVSCSNADTLAWATLRRGSDSSFINRRGVAKRRNVTRVVSKVQRWEDHWEKTGELYEFYGFVVCGNIDLLVLNVGNEGIIHNNYQ